MSKVALPLSPQCAAILCELRHGPCTTRELQRRIGMTMGFHTVTVDVDVDVDDVIDELDDNALTEHGLMRIEAQDSNRARFDQIRIAVHRHDLARVLHLVEMMADDAGVILDTSPLLKVAA